MITIFNRKRLSLDNSAEEAARVWSALRKSKIPYKMKTTGTQTSFGRFMRVGMSLTNGTQRYVNVADTPHYCYTIYVHRRDYARARDAIN